MGICGGHTILISKDFMKQRVVWFSKDFHLFTRIPTSVGYHRVTELVQSRIVGSVRKINFMWAVCLPVPSRSPLKTAEWTECDMSEI